MTQPTDAERADFEKAWVKSGREQAPTRSTLPNKTYAGDAAEFALIWFVRGIQAARRAQVVPQGWKLVPVEPTSEMCFKGAVQIRWSATEQLAAKCYNAMLAAAPQPPKSDQPAFETEVGAAPVQLPEPIGLFSYGAKDTRPTYHHGCFDKDRLNQILDEGVTGGPHRCEFAYAEPQVRQLLAAHGIGTKMHNPD